jgi:hypothetical protein
MDTFTNPQPTTQGPVPASDGREVPTRLRVLATSVAVAGLTATGGLAVILSTGVTGGNATTATTAANLGGAPAQQVPAAPQANTATAGTTLTPSAATSGTTTASPGATAAPAATAPVATSSITNGARPSQPALGNGPANASSGGS